jgi:hypothetical protein
MVKSIENAIPWLSIRLTLLFMVGMVAGRPVYRQHNMKSTALSRLAFHPNAPMVQGNQLPCERQPQSHTLLQRLC